MGNNQRAMPMLLMGATAGAALVLGAQHMSKKLIERREKQDGEDSSSSGSGSDASSEEGYPSCGESGSVASRTPSRGERQPRLGSPRPLPELDLATVNAMLGPEASAQACVEWAYREFGDALVMSTSFGMQSAVLLHMATTVAPRLPIVWIDTGYLHRETYLFARHLAKRLNLNLQVYQSDISAARMEALHGQLWANDDDVSHRVYGVLRKVAPMNRALRDLGAQALLSGVRKTQTSHRQSLARVAYHDGQRHYRVHPLLHWTDADIEAYMTKHKLPYHPLKRKGYVSIGDRHSTKPKTANGGLDSKGDPATDRATRFGGKRQECGLHTERADPAELDALIRQVIDGDTGAVPEPPLLTKTDSTGEFFAGGFQSNPASAASAADALPPRGGAAKTQPGVSYGESLAGVADVETEPQGFEIYGRPSCKFCEAACRVLAARCLPYEWRVMQRFNQATGKLEPAAVDGRTSVSRAFVQRRVDAVAPGSPPIETVPQIFLDGDYVGGYVDLCQRLGVPKPVMEVALLKIGGGVDAANAHTWGSSSPARHASKKRLASLFDADSQGDLDDERAR